MGCKWQHSNVHYCSGKNIHTLKEHMPVIEYIGEAASKNVTISIFLFNIFQQLLLRQLVSNSPFPQHWTAHQKSREAVRSSEVGQTWDRPGPGRQTADHQTSAGGAAVLHVALEIKERFIKIFFCPFQGFLKLRIIDRWPLMNIFIWRSWYFSIWSLHK